MNKIFDPNEQNNRLKINKLTNSKRVIKQIVNKYNNRE